MDTTCQKMDNFTLHPGQNGTVNEPDLLYLRTNLGLTLFMAIALIVSTVVGTFGNLLVVLTVSLVPSLRTCGNMFILNLALADLIITAIVDPFNAAGAISGEHFLMGHHNTLCSVIGSVCAPVCMSSMWNLCLISLNRYVRICHSHHYHRIFTAESTGIMCLSVWVLCYIALIPMHTAGWSRIIFDPDFYLCTADMIDAYSYAVFYIAIGVFLPLTGVLFGYARIFQKVRQTKLQIRRHRRGQLHAVLDADSNCVVTKKIIRKVSGVTREDIMLVKTLFTTFLVFSICWLPFAILVVAGHPPSTPKWIYVIAMVMAHGNSAMNPILYGLSNESFRDGYRRITGCCPRSRISGGGSTLRPLPTTERSCAVNSDACWSSTVPNRARVYLTT